MAAYIGIIHKDEGSDYGVSFPDFPGCVTAGETMDEAITMARSALLLHLDGMMEGWEEIPDPSKMDDVRNHEFAQDAAAFVVVDVPVPRPRQSVKVSITVQKDDLESIDSYARARGMARSAFLVQAAKEVMRG